MLYLATFSLERTSYMQEKSSPPEPKIRLIRAENILAATDLLLYQMEKNDPYGTSYRVEDLEISECIQEEPKD